MATMIDTLKVSRTLAESFSTSHDDLVTKDYLKAQLSELKGDLRTEIANGKTEMIRWMFASQAILIAALVALANFTKLL
jgi:hypothetical protein